MRAIQCFHDQLNLLAKIIFRLPLNLKNFDDSVSTYLTAQRLRAGAGHTRAAEALRAEAAIRFADVEVKHLDVMALLPSSFRALYADYYIKIVERHPSLWAYLYHASDKMPRDALFAKVRRAIERLNTRQLRDAVRNFAADHIICTHFLLAELLAHDIS